MASDGQYLEALRTYYARNRTLPSYAAIGRLIGLSSKASVAEMVGRLKAGRFLDSTPDRRLRPGSRFFARRLADVPVPAGTPDHGDESELGTLNLDEYLVRDPANTFLMRVKGDSMIDAGIREGDIVVVEKRSSADDGKIVVARIGEDVTLKRLRLVRGQPILHPANRNHAAIRTTRGFAVVGVVIGLVRRYA